MSGDEDFKTWYEAHRPQRNPDAKFHPGDRVRLPEIPGVVVREEGLVFTEWDPESDTYVVEVDPQYSEGEGDDLLREVTTDQMERIQRGESDAEGEV